MIIFGQLIIYSKMNSRITRSEVGRRVARPEIIINILGYFILSFCYENQPDYLP